MNKYKEELDCAFREFVRCFDNAEENCDSDYINGVLYDMNEYLKEKY